MLVLSSNITNVYNTSNYVSFSGISQTFITQVIVLVLSGNILYVYNTSNCIGFVRQYLKRL